MRILYFSRSYTTHDYRFLSTISGAGHEVLYLRLENGSQAVEDRPVPAAVQQVQWAGGHGAFRWSAVPRLAWDLKRVIREHKPDLVHAGPVQSCAFISALTGFHPLVTMSWGYDLVQDVHRGRWWVWATRYTLERSDLFISDARVTLDKALAYGMDARHTAVFPWGIDLQHFSPAPSRSPHSQKLVLFCNRAWEPIYGVDVLARAFTQVAARHPGLSLILLGNGSQAAALRQILDGAGLMDRVHFGGKVSQADLPYWYHQADLYISASHVDGSSVSLMEAMACGLPVLVSDIPGNREWVTNDHNGWLFKDGDPDDLASKIQHAFEQRGSLPEMGRQSQKIAEERADWRRNSVILLQAYESVVSSKSHSRAQTVQ